MPDARTYPPTAEAVPEFVAWVDSRSTDDTEARDALWHLAHCWTIGDDPHIWFAHVCRGEWTETVLVYGRPLGWKGDGGGWCATATNPLTVAPSVTCDLCGFHSVFERGGFGFSRWHHEPTPNARPFPVDSARMESRVENTIDDPGRQ